MRYPEHHKEATRQRVLKVGSRALREKGPRDVAVAEVMRAAGLTHGGFYAHFKSKDAFLAETLTQIFAESSARARKLVEGLPPDHALATYIDFYVSKTHRDDPKGGCPIVALASELPRQSKKFQAAFDGGVKLLIMTLSKWMQAMGLEQTERLAASVLSAMSGAVTLSRAVSDQRLSDEMLDSARASIKSRLGLTDAMLSGRLAS